MTKLNEALTFAADYCKTNKDWILNGSRAVEFVVPRQLTALYLREKYEMSYNAIAQLMGGYDPSSIAHMVKQARKRWGGLKHLE